MEPLETSFIGRGAEAETSEPNVVNERRVV
jgi:hypothetical protein